MAFWKEKEVKKLIKEIRGGITKDDLKDSFPSRSWGSIEHKFRQLGHNKIDTYLKVENKTKNSTLKTLEVICVELKKEKDVKLLEEMSRRGYISVREREIKQDLIYPIDIGPKERIGVVADTHLGSQYQQLSHLHRFYNLCKKRGITKILHAGDFTEGNGKLYRGQIYEMFLHGADAQVEYVVKAYPNIKGITTYAIGGSHDYSFYKETGYDVLDAIARQRKDIKYLGMFGAYFKMKNISIYLMHGDSGVAYARSYKMQKILEQISPEKKPNILLLGHYHVPCHLSGYRNVEGLQLPCFQAQTPYLKAKGLYPFVAGEIIEFTSDSKGLTSFKYETIPFYVVNQGDF